MSIVLLLSVILFDGFYKQEAPGSLLHPAPTSLTPHWPAVPLSFGVMLAGFAGHAIVPSLYRDMKRQYHNFLMFANEAECASYQVLSILTESSTRHGRSLRQSTLSWLRLDI